MSQQVYISADYDETSGDRDVAQMIKDWGKDNKHKVDFIDMSEVRSGTVANEEDCRICDLKDEFNRQINASSAVVFIVGDKTASRAAGSACERNYKEQYECSCTPYKKNACGAKPCKVQTTNNVGPADNVGCINCYSYLKHEFMQAKKKNKKIIIFYNSSRKETTWFPPYMNGFEDIAVPFWIKNENNNLVGNYPHLKNELDVE